MLGVWNLGAGGCRGDVIGAEDLGEKQVSFFIQILFAVPAGVRGGGRIGRGCWEMVKDAKPALQPTLVAHIFVL